jgi:hypothetical protein
MKKLLFILFSIAFLSGFSQSYDRLASKGDQSKDNKLMLGGYAQIEYKQPLINSEFNNGKLDIHRMVVLLGYKFNDKISFMSEIEIEHASEVYLEQAYLNYRFKEWLQLRAGLVLIPMGIINENHEPPTFNGVLRPSVDYYIVPTTWREIGFGFTGRIRQASLNYTIYVINGVVGYNGDAKLNGKYGIRKGRQKGISSIIGSPSLTGRVEYFGLKNLKIGLSGFSGSTQTTLNKGLSKDDQAGIDARDSSIVDMGMLGLDAQYSIAGFRFRVQYTYATFANSAAYNEFTGSDLGKSMMGYYIEAAYNVLDLVKSTDHELIPFVRYENYNTQQKIDDPLKLNDAYHREELTAGLGWKPISNVALKADYQLIRQKSESVFSGIINIGVGLMF